MLDCTNKKLRLVDIGAADYQVDKRWLGLAHELDLILFEPDKRSVEALKQSGKTVYEAALSSCEGKRMLNLTRKPQCSSFYLPNMSFLKNFPDVSRWDIVGHQEIIVKTLDSFNLDVDFMKLDTQGSELEILQGAQKTLSGVLGIEVEVSFLEIYQDQPLFADICGYLKKFGMEFFDFVTEYRYGRDQLDRKGQLAFADALFLRPPESLGNFCESKKSKYACIAKAYCKEDLIKVAMKTK